jgi:hypothetical protein
VHRSKVAAELAVSAKLLRSRAAVHAKTTLIGLESTGHATANRLEALGLTYEGSGGTRW